MSAEHQADSSFDFPNPSEPCLPETSLPETACSFCKGTGKFPLGTECHLFEKNEAGKLLGGLGLLIAAACWFQLFNAVMYRW